jgi:hypothetical protein
MQPIKIGFGCESGLDVFVYETTSCFRAGGCFELLGGQIEIVINRLC